MPISQDYLFLILTGAILLVGGLIGYFIFSMMRQFKNYLQLQDGFNQAKVVALEQERQQISADLHDDIGPILSAILYKLSDIEPATQREKELLRQSCDHADTIHVRIRALSSMLMPPAIQRTGPFYALEEFAETYLAGRPLKLEIVEMPKPDLDMFRSLHLFRILQEILHNTLKHARASRLTVDARIENNVLFIETVDDGIGFDPSVIKSKQGLGLQNLAIRSRMIQATLSTQSWPAMGTRYLIRVPLSGNKNGKIKQE
ncbi:MAG: hypothetical protein HZA79_17040 [Sphingobacteriales bacterium]|nr:hypothetical protein [Sphingobacteriales bacterium]